MVPQEFLSDLTVKLLPKCIALPQSTDLQPLAPATFLALTEALLQKAPKRQVKLRTSSLSKINPKDTAEWLFHGSTRGNACLWEWHGEGQRAGTTPFSAKLHLCQMKAWPPVRFSKRKPHLQAECLC